MTPVPNPFRWETRIRFIDTDASGRIHYTCMFRYFESAEVEFLRTLDMIYESKVALRISSRARRMQLPGAVVHDDLLTFELSRRQNRPRLHQARVPRLQGQGAMVAFGSVTIVCMDQRTQIAAHIPEDIRAMLLAAQSAQKAASA